MHESEEIMPIDQVPKAEDNAKAYKTINHHRRIENEIDKAISDRDARVAKAADTLNDKLNLS